MNPPPGYGGRLTACSGCSRPFRHGEVIYVDVAWPVAFCGDRVEDCVEEWREDIGQPSAVHQAEPRRFHGNT